MLTIVDYGSGNLGSLVKAFAKLEVPTRRAKAPEQLVGSSALILPGVGHFTTATQELHKRGLFAPLDALVRGHSIPVLGICLGMHLLGNGSQEGPGQGFGWIDGACERFDTSKLGSRQKIPNMGWRHIDPVSLSPLFKTDDRDWRFYFVHSYHFVPRTSVSILATAEYGQRFVAAVQSGHVTGVQFHPEKSHRFGLTFLRSWVNTLSGSTP